ncbi:hypothetical protein ACTFIW_005915 [Dictyostelium discoideum]
MEILFWKVWKNISVRNQILFRIRLNEIDFGRKDRYYMLKDRVDYSNIISLEWMVTNKQYTILKDKLINENKNNNNPNNYDVDYDNGKSIRYQSYIHITNESVIQLIKQCKDEEVFLMLFKFRKEDLERVDLIVESIKHDSLFSLTIFINLYGIENVRSLYRDSPLLDLSIRLAKLKISNYLVEIGLVDCTRPMLIKNSLFSSPECIKSSNVLEHPVLTTGSLRTFNQLKATFDYLQIKARDLMQTQIKTLNKPLSSSYKSTRGPSPPPQAIQQPSPPSPSDSPSYKDLFQKSKIEYENHHFRYIKSVCSKSEIVPTENERLEFIEDKLNLKIHQLIQSYKSEEDSYPTVDLIKLSPKFGSILIRDSYFKSQVIPTGQNQVYFFNKNYNLEYLINLICSIDKINYCHSINIGKPFRQNEGIDALFKIYKEPRHNLEPLSAFLERFIEVLPIYYIEHFFNRKDFNRILKNAHVLFNGPDGSMYKLFYLYQLSISTFSIKGLETFFSIINPNDSTFFNYVIGVNNLDLTKQPNSSVDELIYFFDYLDSCWSSLMRSSNQNSKPIPWGLLLSNLIRWYDSNTIEALINNSIYFKNQFSSLDTLDCMTMFFIPNQITGCIDYDKLSLFLKYHGSSTTMGVDFNKKPNSIMSNFFHRWDSLYRKENSIEERVKLIHYLTSNENIYQHVFIINSSYYQQSGRKLQSSDDLFNQLFYSSIIGQPLETSIEIYSKLNINQIYKSDYFKLSFDGFLQKSHNLENYFFDNFLIDAIVNNDKDSIIKILSIVFLKNNQNINNIDFPRTTITSTTTNYQVEKEKNMLSTIEYLISNDLLDSFGYNFIFIIIETISNIVKENNKYHCLHENIITELEFLELIKLILLKSKGTQRERPIKTHIKEVSKSNEFYKILLFFENKETKFGQFFQSIEFKEFKSLETKLDMIDKMFLNENNAIKIFKLGYPEYLLDLYTRKPNLNSIYKPDSKGVGFSLINEINTLLAQSCGVRVYEQLFDSLFLPNQEFQNLLGSAILFNRTDVVQFLFETFDVTPSQHQYFFEVFTYGSIGIAKWLFKEYSEIFKYDPFAHRKKVTFNRFSCPKLSLDNIINESLIHGHVGLFKEILKNFPTHRYEITRDTICLIIQNGYLNVVNYLFSIGKLVDIVGIIRDKKFLINSCGIEIPAEIPDHFVSIINNIVEKQLEQKRLKQKQKQLEQEEQEQQLELQKQKRIEQQIKQKQHQQNHFLLTIFNSYINKKRLSEYLSADHENNKKQKSEENNNNPNNNNNNNPNNNNK